MTNNFSRDGAGLLAAAFLSSMAALPVVVSDQSDYRTKPRRRRFYNEEAEKFQRERALIEQRRTTQAILAHNAAIDDKNAAKREAQRQRKEDRKYARKCK